MSRIIEILGWLFLLILIGGCTVRLRDNGEMGISAGYDLKFYHKTAETQAESEATLESQPLMDYLAEDNAEDTGNSPADPE